jgi:uncharacterized protein
MAPRVPQPPSILLPGLVLTGALAAGCASYSDRTAQALAEFRQGRFDEARQSYLEPDTCGSPFLRGAEAGTASLAAGDWDGALADFDAAQAAVERVEERALVSASALGDDLLTWVLNEGARTYEGEGFERVLVHASLALAYLAQGKPQDVMVEAKRANQLLESEEKLYEKQYAAGGLAHFLSAVAYELEGRPDEAYIDYQRMHEKGVGRELAGRALVRLAKELRYSDELKQWTELYGPDSERPAGAASIVVIAGVGLGPHKQEHVLTIPTKSGILQWAVPSFVRRPQEVDGVSLTLSGAASSVLTSVVEDVAKVSQENLEDRIAWLAAKSAVRGVLKRELTEKLQKKADWLGRLAGDLFTLATERADLRAWQSLPDTWQAARVFVAPGVHELRLQARGGECVVLGSFELEKNETMFVLARTLGTRLYAHAIGGNNVHP